MLDEITLRDWDLSGKIKQHDRMGRGGYSEVWRGSLLKDDHETIVAIKVLEVRHHKRKTSEEERLNKRFKRELLHWLNLEHPNIVALLGYTTNPTPSLVSQWYENGNVVEYLESHPFPNRPSLVSDVTKALEYLHSIPMVHGDLKGENVLVNGSGSASLCDFGMSRILDDEQRITGFTTSNEDIGGTVRFMCPELLDNLQKTTMSDMWAFACLVVLILTDKTPYPKITRHFKLPIAIMSGELPHTNQDGSIESNLWSFLTKCWTEASELRPNISELSPHLISLKQWATIRSLKSIAPSQLLKGLSSRVTGIQFSPDGKYLAAASLDGTVAVWHVEVGYFSADPVLLPGEFTGQEVSWSPIKNRLLILSRDYVSVWVAGTNHDGNMFRTQRNGIDPVAWLPSGNAIAYADGHQLFIKDITGSVSTGYALSDARIVAMAFTSDDKRVLLAVDCFEPGSDYGIMVCNMKIPKMEHKVTLSRRPAGITLSKDGQYVLVSSSGGPEIWKMNVVGPENTELVFLHAFLPAVPAILVGKALFGGTRDQMVMCMSIAGDIHIWDRDNAAPLHSLQTSPDMNRINFSRIALASNPASIEKFEIATSDRHWNIQTWTTASPLEGTSSLPETATAPSSTTKTTPMKTTTAPLEKTAPQLGKAPSFDTPAHSPTGEAKNTDLQVNNRSFSGATKFHMHLYNFLAMRRLPEPKPAQVRDGPDTNVTWTASITVEGYFAPYFNAMEKRTFKQTGRTKQAAKDAAARDALVSLGVNINTLQD